MSGWHCSRRMPKGVSSSREPIKLGTAPAAHKAESNMATGSALIPSAASKATFLAGFSIRFLPLSSVVQYTCQGFSISRVRQPVKAGYPSTTVVCVLR
jgi:hypothetical protein